MKKRTASQTRVEAKKVRWVGGAKGLTSQAGLIPVARFLDGLGFFTLLEEMVPHPRGANAVYGFADAVGLTVVGLIGGATSLWKVVTVFADRVLRRCTGWVQIPHDTTLARLFKEVRGGEIAQMEALNHRLRGRVWKRLRSTPRPPGARGKVLWVDADSTVKTVFGHPEGTAKGYNPRHKGARSYHPLLAFCTETKELLQGWLRSGDAYTSNGIVGFVQQLLAHLPRSTRLLFRADSGFFRGDLLDFLEAGGHRYLIKVKLRNLKGLLSAQTWQPIPGQPGWEQTVFSHACHGWSQARVLVAVRCEKAPETPSAQEELWEYREYDHFCYVTTEDLTPWQTHKTYGARATSETWIDEAKNQMALAHLKTDTFLANAALFQCAVLAYNTVRWMARVSGHARLARWEIQTVRAFLVRVAGKLTTGGHQQVIHTPNHPLDPGAWNAWLAVGGVT